MANKFVGLLDFLEKLDGMEEGDRSVAEHNSGNFMVMALGKQGSFAKPFTRHC